jgi:rhamnopyranosyl-N-acetylglucosaminyl-diphospho-decaprenol beta-1,3/1,4-galactofuranosyltransferase
VTETSREKTAAVVVTYNRKDLLAACLESLLRQTCPLDAIYIIDNHSTDGTYDELLGRGWIDPIATTDSEPDESVKAVPTPAHSNTSVEIRYVRLAENTGGAGGFHEGMRRGNDDGFDWLWLMDDDLLVCDDALEVLVRHREALLAQRGHTFLLNSLVLAKEPADGDTLAVPLQERGRRGYPKLGVYYHHLSEVADKVEDGRYRWACPFNATLVPTCAIAQVGLPNKDLFIWGDEREYLWRAAKVLDFFTVIESRVFHPRFLGLTFNWKLYYHIRNAFAVNEQLDFTALRNLKLTMTGLAMGLRHGKAGLALVSRAIRDGRARRLGKRQDLPG